MIRNLTQLLSFSLLSTMCAFLLQVVAAKILSINDYGSLAKWLTDVNYLGLFFIFGLDNSLMFFSKEHDRFQTNLGKNIVFFSSISFLAIFFVFLFGLDFHYYIFLIMTIFCFALYQSANAFNQLNEYYRVYGFFVFLKSLILLIPFLIIYTMSWNVGFRDSIIIYAGSSVVLLICIGVFLKNRIKIKMEKSYDIKYFKYGFKSMFNTFLAITLYTISIYLLDYLSTKEAIAIFFIASTIAKLAWIIPDTAGNILYPKYLKIKSIADNESVMNQTFLYGQVIFLINIFSIVVFYISGKFFLSAFFDESYQKCFYPILILLIGNQGMVYYKIIGRFLAAKNEWSVLRKSLLAGVITNCLLALLLIKNYGIVGVSISTAVSFWVCGAIVSLHVKGSFYKFMNLNYLFKNLRLLKSE